ncbi:MAG: 50S ribosomal protein L11 methyltransferase [Butyrivibrio sp.]|nr:50S ribosomal protein L11 methyltransferase [Butyrivibrio sp.]
MRWVRFRVRTNVESEDICIAEMADIGLSGAQIEDHVPLTAAEKEQMFTDDLQCAEEEETGINAAMGTSSEDEATLSFYVELDPETGALNFPEGTELAEIYGDRVPSIDEVQQRIVEVLDSLRAFTDVGDGTVSVELTEDLDWINNWKQFFRPFSIDDIHVIPSWYEETSDAEAGDGAAALTLRIDPGTAFGTGQHESTRLAIRALRRSLQPGDSLLDVGTGSGILSVVALLSGAASALGTDLDPGAVPAVADNLTRNGLSSAQTDGRFTLLLGNLLDDLEIQAAVGLDEPRYDVVVANILPYVLVPLTPLVPRLLKKGGTYITSGILTEKNGPVRAAMEAAGFVRIEQREDGEWCSLTGVLPV